MKALLLGPNGQLGSDIQRFAAGEAALSLLPFGRDQADLGDIDGVARAIQTLDFDALINCTGYHRTDEAESNRDYAYAINAQAVRALAEICAVKRARFVHVSTDYVFGGDARRTPYTEELTPAPLNVYGASKAEGEALARAAHEDVLIVRVASLFGVAGASGKGGNFVETMLRLARERGALEVVDDQIMSPTAAADAAGAILALLRTRAAAGVYHVVNDCGGVSWRAFAQEIVAQAGLDVSVAAASSATRASAARRPAYSALDNAKLANAGVAMRPWRDALHAYLVAKGHIAS
ncbi:MAG: dTDP-4-dehydrorhamnose reductase [Alphaproteobacteria bacterium]|nr:dTDP-4-dehydrorhamnose reductase [Alphaproteobacteria bacterium]